MIGQESLDAHPSSVYADYHGGNIEQSFEERHLSRGYQNDYKRPRSPFLTPGRHKRLQSQPESQSEIWCLFVGQELPLSLRTVVPDEQGTPS